MFCPDGYIPLSQMSRITPDDFHDKQEEEYRKELDYLYENSIEDLLQYLSESTPNDDHEDNLFRSVIGNVSICSSSGQILKFDMQTVLNIFREFQLSHDDICNFSNKIENDNLRNSDFISNNDVLRGVDSSIEKLIKLFVPNKYRSNGESINSIYDWLYINGHMLFFRGIPLFYERQGYTIDLRVYDDLKHYAYPNISQLDNICRILRPYQGWALCVTEKYVNDGWLQQLEKYRFIHDESAQSIPKFGRPPKKRLKAFQAYSSLYPDGHSNETWPEVSKRVTEYAGEYISPDTIRRAIEGAKLPQKAY